MRLCLPRWAIAPFSCVQAALLLSAMLMGASAQGQQRIVDESLDERDGSRIEVRSVFDPLPSSGYAPLRIVATNGSGRDAVWRLDFNSQTQDYRNNNVHRSEVNLSVPARSTQTALFLAPLAVDYGDSSGYGQSGHVFSGSVTGPVVRSFSSYSNRNAGFPAIAISKTLADGSLDRLNDELERKQKAVSSYSRGDQVFGSRFVPADLPEDWLGFSGFDYVMLTDTEWQSLRPGSRNALLQWVRLGGRLHFYVTKLPANGLPADDKAFSLGQIETFTWNGRNIPADETVSRYWQGVERLEQLRLEHTRDSDWGPLAALGKRSFNSWQVIVFLVLFGVLVGPVNLYILAPSGRRHRLFFTTPLLSLGASLAMVGIILLQDGIGGIGARVVFINVEPAEASAYVTQKQTSRTGVLLGAGFELKQPALVEPLALPASDWVKLKNTSDSQPVNLTQQGAARGGNFFQSRAEQAQMVRAAISTRGRLEIQPGTTPDAPPTLVSALGFTLEEMFYAGPDGTIWSLKSPLATGQKAELAKVQPGQLGEWWRRHVEIAKIPATKELTSVLPNHFFATAKSAPGFTQETLSAIRWQEDKILVYGSVPPP